MKWLKNKKVIAILVLVLIIAAGLDIAFEGLFYQMLPEAIQNWF